MTDTQNILEGHKVDKAALLPQHPQASLPPFLKARKQSTTQHSSDPSQARAQGSGAQGHPLPSGGFHILLLPWGQGLSWSMCLLSVQGWPLAGQGPEAENKAVSQGHLHTEGVILGLGVRLGGQCLSLGVHSKHPNKDKAKWKRGLCTVPCVLILPTVTLFPNPVVMGPHRARGLTAEHRPS